MPLFEASYIFLTTRYPEEYEALDTASEVLNNDDWKCGTDAFDDLLLSNKSTVDSVLTRYHLRDSNFNCYPDFI